MRRFIGFVALILANVFWNCVAWAAPGLFIGSGFGQKSVLFTETEAEYAQKMDSIYSKDYNDESEKLFDMAFTVYSEVNFPKANDWLRRCAEEYNLPAVTAFVDGIEAKTVDCDNQRQHEALTAISRVADKKLGKTNDNAIRIAYFATESISQFKDVVSQQKALLKRFPSNIEKSADTSRKALYYIIKLSSILNTTTTEIILDPDHYDEIFKIEREFSNIYDHTDLTNPTIDRIIAYRLLGNANSSMDIKLHYNDCLSKHGYAPGMEYIWVNAYPTDAHPYYFKAKELCKAIMPERHPFCVTKSDAEFNYRASNFSIDAETTQVAEEFTDYYAQMGPMSYNCLQSKLRCWNLNIMADKHNSYGCDLWQIVDSYEKSCSNKISILCNLKDLMWVAVLDFNKDYEKFNKHLENRIDELFAKRPIHKITFQFFAYSYIKDILPDLYQAKLTEISNILLSDFDSSPLALYLSQVLSEEFFMQHDYENATRILERQTSTLCNKYGKDAGVSLASKGNLLRVKSFYKPEEAIAEYPEVMSSLNREGLEYIGFLDNYAKTVYALGQDQDLADRLFNEWISLPPESIEKQTYAQHILSYLLMKSDVFGMPIEGNKYFEETIKIITGPLDEKPIIQNYDMAHELFLSYKDFFNSNDILKLGIELNETYCGGILNEETMPLYLNYNRGLFYHFNETATSLKNMRNLYNALNSDHPLYSSTIYLDFIRTYVHMGNQSGSLSATSIMHILTFAMRKAESVLKQSNFNEQIAMQFIIPILSDAVAIISPLVKTMFDDMEQFELDDSVLQYLPNDISNFKQNMKKAKETLIGYLSFYDGFDSAFLSVFPSYEHSIVRDNFLRALAAMHLYINDDFERAESIYLDLIANTQQDNFYKYILCSNLSTYYIEQKMPDKAMEFYEKGKSFMEEDPDLTLSEKIYEDNDYIRILKLYGKDEEIIPYARNNFKDIKTIYDTTFDYMTEEEQDGFMNKNGSPAEIINDLLEQFPEELAADCYDGALYVTGLQLRSQREFRKALLETADTETLGLMDSISQLKNQRDMVITTDFSFEYGEKQQALMKQKSQLSRQINLLENELIEKTKDIRIPRKEVTHDMIIRKLRDDEAAIEFVHSEKRCMALLLRKGFEKPIAIPLALHDDVYKPLSSLDKLTSSERAHKLYSENFLDLYSLLWKPIEPHLKGVKKVYYATPGYLGSLSFPAFKVAENKYLIDKYDMCPLTTTAMILEEKEDPKCQSALLVGGVYYSPTQERLVKSGAKIGNTEGIRSFIDFDEEYSDSFERSAFIPDEERRVHTDHFSYLEWTGPEVDDIEGLMKRSGVADTRVLKGENASEQSFRDRIQEYAPDIVHLSTHGFFIANSDVAFKIPYYYKYRQNLTSMRRTGITFYDAERGWTGTSDQKESNDGILSGVEFSDLNLDGTKLVTLSACETALGNYSFEGTFGLPRGLKMAGAKSMLVSLWSVRDNSTAMFMQEFYGNLFRGAGMRHAWIAAMKAVRNKFPDPVNWAPFTLLDPLN